LVGQKNIAYCQSRRGGRAVECTGLEIRHRGNSIGGSNPSLSAKLVFMDNFASHSAKISIIYTTMSPPEAVEKIAQEIVEKKLAVCINIFPKVKSIYRYENKIVVDDECSMIIKTSVKNKEKMITWLLKNHPYDLPAILYADLSCTMEFFSYVEMCMSQKD
jgi:periplasmic divalent cation tolerance protein